jgi:signal transduction histidine kinase
MNLHKEIEMRKQVENSLRLLQNELEQRIEMRTRELEKANVLLHQALKMEAIGQLAGTIAHDFNNYLSIIMGYSAFLVKKLDSKVLEHEYAQIIEKTAHTAAELTSQLLTFVRKKKFNINPINTNELINDMKPLLSSILKNGIKVNYNIDPNFPVFSGGIDQIKSALLNLCINARDAMNKNGTLTLTTKTVEVTPEYCETHRITCLKGTYASIAVSDTGTGIQDDVFKHLFEPFFTTKEEGKGTGMGLAAVYGIMKSHQGAVFAETELGKGTTFTLLFPLG